MQTHRKTISTTLLLTINFVIPPSLLILSLQFCLPHSTCQQSPDNNTVLPKILRYTFLYMTQKNYKKPDEIWTIYNTDTPALAHHRERP